MGRKKLAVKTNHIHQGDALEVLKTIPSQVIDMVVTSPPYWSLRDYGVKGQIGLEPAFGQYLDKLCRVFDEVKRVLKPAGSCWVNLGDTYSQSGGTGKHRTGRVGMNKSGGHRAKNLPPKCLCLIPSRFALEMCRRGWVLRNELIWWKPNCLPSSAKDRFTVDFEKLFFFTQGRKYYFQQQFEPHLTKERRPNGLRRQRIYHSKSKFNHHPQAYSSPRARTKGKGYKGEHHFYHRLGRNKRTVWAINTKPFPDNHFAVFPEELVETPIKAGCPQFVCTMCGIAAEKVDANKVTADNRSGDGKCNCNSGFEAGIVLDPFMGAGTTALAAVKLGRRFIGIELKKEYIQIANNRIKPYLSQAKVTNFV
ncbi:site-specific DNA-methyltransferase [bacterium]|nr:site-specific DNA-methyltransferase [bacterium]